MRAYVGNGSLSTESGAPQAPPGDPPLQRRRWHIRGRVQGVGFRPFVHFVARRWGLTGFVCNNREGVLIEAQGAAEDLDRFARQIEDDSPSPAVIELVRTLTIAVNVDEDGFAIRRSDMSGSVAAAVAPDLATCPDCVADVTNQRDQRRFHYGLTNCTKCGPRFSIVRAIPYDRRNTTMSAFGMCSDCRGEYEDPSNRRFHAQPIACHSCGPEIALAGVQGARIPGDAIARAADRLAAGEIVAIQGIGGFHLAVRADDEQAVQRLRQSKHRPSKPFALMVASVSVAEQLVTLSDGGRAMLSSPAAPIVVAPRKSDARIADAVAPANHRLGVMLPYTPIHHLLFERLRGRCDVLVMTSGNDSDEPLIFERNTAVEKLAGVCSSILWHERPIHRPVDDSVVLDAGDRAPILLRRSRGFVPTAIALPRPYQTTGIALGGELKSTFAIVRDGKAILSQHLGDLSHPRTYAAFKHAIDDLLGLFDVQPQWVAHDLHPNYMSTSYARQLANALGVPQIGVQHHHAHAAAVLAEHGLTGPALAVVCDGTGYGSDGTIWGGELLAVSLSGFRRLGHLRPMPLPGGDAASRQTWRCALAMLQSAFGSGFAELPIACEIVPDERQRKFVARMLQSRTNCIVSSAAGRLFDGVAALLGLARENRFEAEAALALEGAAARCGDIRSNHQTRFDITNADSIEIDFSPLVREMVSRRAHGAAVEELAELFHQQFAAAWESAVMLAVERTGLSSVVLSGGVMCNQRIDRLLTDRLRARGLRVLRHRLVPPNDGGISLGQAALAAHRFGFESR